MISLANYSANCPIERNDFITMPLKSLKPVATGLHIIKPKITDLGFVRPRAKKLPLYFDKGQKKIIVGMCGDCFEKGWDCCRARTVDVPLLALQTTKDAAFDVRKHFVCDKNGAPFIVGGKKCPQIGETSCNLQIKNRPLVCNIFPYVIAPDYLSVDAGVCPAVGQQTIKHLHEVGKQLLNHLLKTYSKEELAAATYKQSNSMINLGLYF